MPSIRKLLIFSLWTAAAAFGQGPEVSARADVYVAQEYRNGAFRGSVLVARQNDILYPKSFGAGVDENSRFRIASVTKPLVATAVLQQVERGNLGLDDPVSRYLPLPSAWRVISVRHLLSQTSGIPNYTEVLSDAQRQQMHPQSLSEVIATVKDLPLQFTPGSEFRYSNSNYTVLGMLLEKLSGLPYCAVLARDVLVPAAMSDSGCTSKSPTPGLVDGLRRNWYGRAVPTEVEDPAWPNSAGSLYSTPSDLYRFTRALRQGKLLRQNTLDQMWHTDGRPYGLGWFVENVNGRRLVWHSGVIAGFHSMLAWYVDQDAVAIVTANFESNEPLIMGRDLAALALGDPVQPRPRHFTKEQLVLPLLGILAILAALSVVALGRRRSSKSQRPGSSA